MAQPGTAASWPTGPPSPTTGPSSRTIFGNMTCNQFAASRRWLVSLARAALAMHARGQNSLTEGEVVRAWEKPETGRRELVGGQPWWPAANSGYHWDQADYYSMRFPKEEQAPLLQYGLLRR